jgi:hypothetical protein
MKTPYQTFWEFLPLALVIAEQSAYTHAIMTERRYATVAMGAIARLKKIEAGGNMGYLNNNDPFQAISDYIAHAYSGGPVPFWLMSAERG